MQLTSIPREIMLIIVTGLLMMFGGGCAVIIDSAFDTWTSGYRSRVREYKDRGFSPKDARDNALFDEMLER